MATIDIALWAPVAALMAAHVAARAVAKDGGSTLTLPSLTRRAPPSPAVQERG